MIAHAGFFVWASIRQPSGRLFSIGQKTKMRPGKSGRIFGETMQAQQTAPVH
jgi:hypothetical protein